MADQLREIGPSGVVFFTRDAEADPGAQPYRSCCEEACRLAGVPCRVIELPLPDETFGSRAAPDEHAYIPAGPPALPLTIYRKKVV